MGNLINIEGGKGTDKEIRNNLLVTIHFKDDGDILEGVRCHFMGHSVDNPMMLTLIKLNEEGDEIPVQMINCDTVKSIAIEEVKE